MNIAVFCGSNFGTEETFREAAAEVGGWLADKGHTLIYGGSDRGLMGVLADTAVEGGGRVIGVEPRFFLGQGLEHPGITKTIPCETMSERKSIMMEMSDAYIALPGGPGTLDELTEVIVLSGLGREDKPCILYNKEGYYDDLLAFYDKMLGVGFMDRTYRSKILAVKSPEELDALLG